MVKNIISFIIILTMFFAQTMGEYSIVYGASTTILSTNAKITEYTGTVKVKRSGSIKKIDAFNNMTISTGDKIVTSSDGSATILLNEKNVVVLGKSTSITISKLNDIDKEPNSGYTLNYGSATNNVKTKTTGDSNYEINTVNTVMGVRGTVFDVIKKLSDFGDERIEVITIDGAVAVDELKYFDEGKYNQFNEVGSVIKDKTIIFDEENDGIILDLDVTKLNAEELVWLYANKEYLSAYNIEKIESIIEEKIKIENEKLIKIGDVYKSNEKISYENTTQRSNIVDENKGNNTNNDTDYNNTTGNTEEDSGNTNENKDEDKEESDYELAENVLISSAEDLHKFNQAYINNLNGVVVKTITLGNDIDFSKYNWSSINIKNIIFDGRGYTIKNISVLPNTSDYVGMFGTVENSHIKNLSIDNLTFLGEAEKTPIAQGILAGYIKESKIEDIKIQNIKDFGYGDSVGVIAGYVSKLYYLDDITIKNIGTIYGVNYAGGVIGTADGAIISDISIKDILSIKSKISSGGFTGKSKSVSLQNVNFNVNSSVTTVIMSDENAGGIAGELEYDLLRKINLNNCKITAKNVSYFVGDGDMLVDFGCTYNNVVISTNVDNVTIFGDVIVIKSAKELSQLNEFLYNNPYTKITSISLDKNIDFTGYTWKPVALGKGIFNGNKYTLSNITIAETEESITGMFTSIDGGGVKDLTIENITFSNNKNIKSSKLSKYSGSLVGEAKNAEIKNVNIFNVDGFVPSVYTGGLVGKIYNSKVSDVTVMYIDNLVGYEYVGGLAGYADNVTVSNIIVSGINNILGESTDLYISSEKDKIHAGGCFGYVKNSTVNTVSVEDVIEIKGGSTSGGLAGFGEKIEVNAITVNNITNIESLYSSSGIIGVVNNGTITSTKVSNSNILSKNSGNIIGIGSEVSLDNNTFSNTTLSKIKSN